MAQRKLTFGRNSPPGVSLFGHLSHQTGLGTAARATLAALRAAGLAVKEFDLDHADAWEEPDPASVNLIHTNPGRKLAPDSLTDVLGDRRSIGFWVWETGGIPDTWRPWLQRIDELWVPSRFVADSVAAEVEVPIVVLPLPVQPPKPATDGPIPELLQGRFRFLFAFDTASILARKNPLGLIEAYRMAFPTSSGRTLLLLKTKRASASQLTRLNEAIAGRPDIAVVNQELDPEQLSRLFARCDCYVSLHKAEGFGLTLAEAMYFGKPVIATGYSGNTDFMSEDTAFPVKYELRQLQEDHGPYPAGSTFAFPDIAHAAELMRTVVANPAEATRRAEKGSAWVRANLSPAAVGARMKERLLCSLGA